MDYHISPIVSVIIPVYNAGLYLEQSLKCVVQQTLRNIEIICIDDGSSDNSAAILEAFEAKDPRIHIISQKNKGLSEARNIGLKNANGKYLYFFDSDDILELDALEILSCYMDRYQLEYLCFNADSFGHDPVSIDLIESKYKRYFDRSLQENVVYSGVALFAALKSNNNYISAVWLSMTLKSFIIENELFFHPGIIHEDEPWTFSVLLNASRAGCVNRLLYHYRIHPDSIANSQPSFKNELGLFYGTLDMSKTILKCTEPYYKPEDIDLLISHLKWMQNRSINIYYNISEEEKAKRKSLPLNERVTFEEMIATSADQILFLNEQLKRSKSEISSLKHSCSYRVGRLITWLPRKLRALSKAILGHSYSNK